MDKTHIHAVFVILDVGQMIENSSVFQAQVIDQVIALSKLGHSTLVVCTYQDQDKFQLVAGNKLDDYNIPFVLVADSGLVKNIMDLKNISFFFNELFAKNSQITYPYFFRCFI